MKFEIDHQTFSDLEIFDRPNRNISVYNLFAENLTEGGKTRLLDIFSNPLADIGKIKERLDIIAYFRSSDTKFKLDKHDASFADFYLRQTDYPVAKSKSNSLSAAIKHKFRTDNESYVLRQGIAAAISLLNQLHEFSLSNIDKTPSLIAENNKVIFNLFELPFFKKTLSLKEKIDFSASEINDLDYAIRNTHKHSVKVLLDVIYDYECLINVAHKSLKLGFNIPAFNAGNKQSIAIKGLFHPFIANPIANDVEFSPHKNVLFLSGANMAGKSTFLKSFSVAMYLAHLGFPVPARSMITSVFDGISTTINIQDNLSEGYSHFYSEVLRVKAVAEKLASRQRMFVVFDELFRGTNVKDAYDGSLAIINAFSKVKNSFFIISTHIVEIAEALQSNNSVDYICFEARLQNNIPCFDYKLKNGVSNERLGMWIIENEKLVELIERSL